MTLRRTLYFMWINTSRLIPDPLSKVGIWENTVPVCHIDASLIKCTVHSKQILLFN